MSQNYEQAMAEAVKWHDANIAYDQIGGAILLIIYLGVLSWLIVGQLTSSGSDDDFPQGPKGT